MLGFVNILSALPDMLDGLFSTFLVEESGPEDAEPLAAHSSDFISPGPTQPQSSN
jgi:hypothetical protein